MYEVFNFPGGEVHVKYESEFRSIPPKVHIPRDGMKLNDWLMASILAASMVKRDGIAPELHLPYLPYARQDRHTSKEEPFSLKVLGELLNSQNYSKVLTLDVHSDVAFGAINNLVNVPVEYLLMYHDHNQISYYKSTLVIPDQGAVKRLHKAKERFESVVTAIKHRDTNTGELSIETVIGDVKDRDCLIVDDICDGGGTFVLLAEKLYEMGAKSVHLYVTHGIFSKGFEPLVEAGIKSFMTTDSVQSQGSLYQLSHYYGLNLNVASVKEIIRNYVE